MAQQYADEMFEENDRRATASSKAAAEIGALRADREDLIKEHKHLAEELDRLKDELGAYTEAVSAELDASATQRKELETAVARKDGDIRDLLTNLQACQEQQQEETKDREERERERERGKEEEKVEEKRAGDESRIVKDGEFKAMETALAEKDFEIHDLLTRLKDSQEQLERERRAREAERQERERKQEREEEKESPEDKEKERKMTVLHEEVSAAKTREVALAAANSELQCELEAARAAQDETKTREAELTADCAKCHCELKAARAAQEDQKTRVAELTADCAECHCELEAARAAQEDLKTREAELAAACSELQGKVASLQEVLTRQGQEADRVQIELEASREMVKQQADDDAARRERERESSERRESDRSQVAALQEHNERLGEEVARLEADVSRLQKQCMEEKARASKHEEASAVLRSRQQEVWAELRRDLDGRVARLEEEVCFPWICGCW